MDALRDRNKRDKEARILDAARALFASEGFEATTTRAIAARAEVASGTLFLYARTKEELVVRLWHAEISAAVEEAFSTLPESGLLDELTHLFGSFYSFYEKDLPLSRIYLREILLPTAGEPASSLTTGFLDRLGERFLAASERGEIGGDFLPFLAASNAFGAYLMGLLALVSGQLPPDAVRHYLSATLSLQIQGLGPGKNLSP